MNDETVTVEVKAAPAKVAPPPRPEAPLADLATLLSSGGDVMEYRNEQFRFDFRTDSETKTRRPSFWLTGPVITWEGLLKRTSDPDPVVRGKYQNYVLDLISGQVFNAMKAQVGDEENPVNRQDDLKVENITLDALVNQPASVRRGNGISKEIWEAFGKDYLAVMPTATGKSVERINNQVKLLLGKFAACKTQKKVIKKLQEELEIYITATTELESYADCVEFLMTKSADLLNMTEETMLESL